MRKGKDVIGKQVVALEGGERLASVHDIIFDQETNQVLAFLVDEGGWFSSAKVLPLEAVSSVGENAIVITSRDQIVSASQIPMVDAILRRNNILKGTTLMTTDGRNLGKLADLYFEEGTGRVTGYDVTGGLFADVASGRSYVPAPTTLTIGEDVAFVPPETATAMEEAPAGGVRGALAGAGQSVSGAAGGLAANAREVTSERQREFVIGKTASREVRAKDSTLIVEKDAVITPADADRAEAHGSLGALFASAGGGAIGGLVSGATDRTLEGTMGRRVGNDVRSEGNLLVAAQGQIVTQDVIDRARRYGREQQLIAAVYREGAAGATAAAGERLQQGAQSVKEGAQGLLERARETFDTTREKAAVANEERRINAALGRPVTRVILDQQDNVILNLGELVTHKAIEDARSADALGILLDSIYTDTPRLSVDDLRAPEPGRASLEVEHGIVDVEALPATQPGRGPTQPSAAGDGPADGPRSLPGAPERSNLPPSGGGPIDPTRRG